VTDSTAGPAGQGRADRRATAQRDLELLVMEIAAAQERLDELRRREEEVRAIISS
jgi:hypothetical protein